MKQLSALGARRHFFRNPRRMRALRPGEELGDSPDMMGPGFGYLGKLNNSHLFFFLSTSPGTFMIKSNIFLNYITWYFHD